MKFKIEVNIIGTPYYHTMSSNCYYDIFSIIPAVKQIADSIASLVVTVEQIEDAVIELLTKGVATIGGNESKTKSYITVRRV